MEVKEGLLKRIHVNQHNIRKNGKGLEEPLPVITCKTSKGNIKTNTLEILDENGTVIATILYSPEKPLSCGAKVWVETKCAIRTVGDEPPNEESLCDAVYDCVDE